MSLSRRQAVRLRGGGVRRRCPMQAALTHAREIRKAAAAGEALPPHIEGTLPDAAVQAYDAVVRPASGQLVIAPGPLRTATALTIIEWTVVAGIEGDEAPTVAAARDLAAVAVNFGARGLVGLAGLGIPLSRLDEEATWDQQWAGVAAAALALAREAAPAPAQGEAGPRGDRAGPARPSRQVHLPSRLVELGLTSSPKVVLPHAALLAEVIRRVDAGFGLPVHLSLKRPPLWRDDDSYELINPPKGLGAEAAERAEIAEQLARLSGASCAADAAIKEAQSRVAFGAAPPAAAALMTRLALALVVAGVVPPTLHLRFVGAMTALLPRLAASPLASGSWELAMAFADRVRDRAAQASRQCRIAEAIAVLEGGDDEDFRRHVVLSAPTQRYAPYGSPQPASVPGGKGAKGQKGDGGKGGKEPRGGCYNCGEGGHAMASCPQPRDEAAIKARRLAAAAKRGKR
eukprot:TRINITY_DN2918_c0_g1_i2.p2 TRINITY_DN2918_c0_g1~~TRINITY_DN2918_c0_g1_i2.p2  ORF type:complete len:459 (-),score=105.85 TRINITY_DN2918_c0_g1_i2:2784-4160(-)